MFNEFQSGVLSLGVNEVFLAVSESGIITCWHCGLDGETITLWKFDPQTHTTSDVHVTSKTAIASITLVEGG